MTQTDFPLPSDLPEPVDDGAADHLAGVTVPDLEFPATDGSTVSLRGLPGPRTVIYIYPMTGRPGVALPDGWDLIPGARGCTPESCGFRDHHAELEELGASVFGFSSQETDYQAEAAQRLELPFPILSDPTFALDSALSLPTFETEGRRLYKRLTLVLSDGTIEHVFYPIFPPDTHAAEVLAWLKAHPKN
jgi:peroxiredoxin